MSDGGKDQGSTQEQLLAALNKAKGGGDGGGGSNRGGGGGGNTQGGGGNQQAGKAQPSTQQGRKVIRWVQRFTLPWWAGTGVWLFGAYFTAVAFLQGMIPDATSVQEVNSFLGQFVIAAGCALLLQGVLTIGQIYLPYRFVWTRRILYGIDMGANFIGMQAWVTGLARTKFATTLSDKVVDIMPDTLFAPITLNNVALTSQQMSVASTVMFAYLVGLIGAGFLAYFVCKGPEMYWLEH